MEGASGVLHRLRRDPAQLRLRVFHARVSVHGTCGLKKGGDYETTDGCTTYYILTESMYLR